MTAPHCGATGNEPHGAADVSGAAADGGELGALMRRLGAGLTAHPRRLVTAESCTGGLLAGLLTSLPGSSAWFERGFITYTNEAKQELLGVSALTLERHGAVSLETAREMACGALAHAPAELAAAVTGIAGPGGGSADKPVGTVCIALAVRGGWMGARRWSFAGDRSAVRTQSVRAAVEGMLELMTGNAVEGYR